MPPIPEDVVRVRFVFSLGAGSAQADEAVMGFHLKRVHGAGNPTNWPDDIQNIAASVLHKWVTRVTDRSAWSSEVILNRVEAYHLEAATGHTLDKGMAAAVGAEVWRGAATTASLPFEVACAVSLYAYPPGGFDRFAKNKRGRFYLPPFATATMDDTANRMGSYRVTSLTAVSTALNAFLNDVQGMHVGPFSSAPAGFDTMDLVVLSVPKVATFPVVAQRIGVKPDSQKRRARSGPEQYIESAIAQGA